MHDPRPLPPWTDSETEYPAVGCARERFRIHKDNIPKDLPYSMNDQPLNEGGFHYVYFSTFFCKGHPPVEPIQPGDLCFNQAQSTVHMYNGEAWVKWEYPTSKDKLIRHPHFRGSRFLTFSKDKIGWYSPSRLRYALPNRLSNAQMVTKAISQYRNTRPYDGSNDSNNATTDRPNGPLPQPSEGLQSATDESDSSYEPARQPKRRRTAVRTYKSVTSRGVSPSSFL